MHKWIEWITNEWSRFDGILFTELVCIMVLVAFGTVWATRCKYRQGCPWRQQAKPQRIATDQRSLIPTRREVPPSAIPAVDDDWGPAADPTEVYALKGTVLPDNADTPTAVIDVAKWKREHLK